MSNGIKLIIKTENSVITPKVLEGIKYNSERYGTPGELNFQILQDEFSNLIEEGDEVAFHYGDTPVFFGYVFTIKRTRDEVISITAFDQLRYLKNKDTYEYLNKRADEVVKLLADDFRLQVGELENTEFIIPKRKEDNKSLIDIINTSLGITTQNIKKIFILYDNFGKINLKNMESLGIEILIDESVTENYSYTSSIDNKTYNQIKIIEENEKEGKRSIWVEKSTKNQNKWGILQTVEIVDSTKENPLQKAQALLSLHNQVFKKLSLKNVRGDVRCKGGFSLTVKLDLKDVLINHKMIINRVTHTFNYQEHLMNLDLIGGVINV